MNEECQNFYSKRVFVESADADTFVKGENVTFVNWGNLKIENVKKGIKFKPFVHNERFIKGTLRCCDFRKK